MTEKNIESLSVGIVGHIDHGKTTLLQKLSGKWASQHSEELKRGITIKLGYADVVVYEDSGVYNLKGKGKAVKRLSFIDAPGHEMLMATMLSGAALIDVAILVIAANEGIKPQTREHLMALQAKGIENILVVQNKIDLVDKEEAKKNYDEIRKFLFGIYKDAKVIPVSAQQEVNIQQIFKELVELKAKKRDENAEPIFVVARSFDVNKPGTKPEDLTGAVLGGILRQGKLKVGDEIEIKPGRIVKEANQQRYETIKTKISGLFKSGENVKELTPGGSMAIGTELDMALGKSDALAGNVVSLSGKLPELTQTVKVKFKIFPEVYGTGKKEPVQPIKVSEMLMLSVNTSTTGGAVKFLRGDEAEMNLRVPVVVFKGDNVGIARNIAGHWRLIGYGEIL